MRTGNGGLGPALARAAAVAAWVTTAASVGASLLVWGSHGFEPQPLSFASGVPGGLAVAGGSIVFVSIGAVLVHRLPANAIGWLLVAFGALLGSLPPVNLAVGDVGEVFGPVPAVTLLMAWLQSSFLTPTLWAIVVLVTLLFPDGRPTSRRWSLAAVPGVGGAALVSIASAVSPDGLLWYPSLPNPAAAPSSLATATWAATLGGLGLMVVGMGLAVASSIVRYRRGSEATRHQLHWFVLAAVVMAGAAGPFAVARYAVDTGEPVGEWLLVLAIAGACLLPVSVAAAITRYRLFGLDAFVGRTLVYVPLIAILGGQYSASVALFQRVFVALTGDTSDAAAVLSTLILAAAFTPVRKSLEGLVDRHFKPASSAAGVPAGAGSPVAPAVAPAADPAFDARLAALEAELRRLETVAAERAVRRAGRPGRVPGARAGRPGAAHGGADRGFVGPTSGSWRARRLAGTGSAGRG